MIKTISAAVFVFLIFGSTVYAGDLIEIGLKLGANISTPTDEPSGFQVDNGVGVTGGIYAQVPIT